MSRQLVIHIPVLTDAQRASIAGAAAARGFEPRFLDEFEAAKKAAAEAEVIFASDAALLEGASDKLKWLCVTYAGVNHVLKPVLEDRSGILLTNSSGAYGVTIAEHILMVTLAMMRRLPEYGAVVAQRGWQRALPVRSIKGSRVTLLGTGDIGREAAKRIRAFGPKSIVGVNRRGKAPEGFFDAVYTVDRLDDVLPETDVLILSLPATPATAGLMDDQRLRLLPEDAYLVNVGRGSLIDQAALEAQLREGRFAGVALDVFTQEPVPPEATLWDAPRLLITPHVAGNMTLPYTVQRIVELFLEDFERYCDGQPLARDVARREGY